MSNDCPKMSFLLFLKFLIYSSFLTTLFFTTSLSSVNSTKTGTNLSISNLSTLLFKLFKPLDTVLIYQYLIYLDQISNFKLAKSAF